MIDLSLHDLSKFKQTSFPLGCNNPHIVLINPETGRLITTPPAQLTGIWKPITNNLTQVTSDISPCCVHSWMLPAADHLSLSPAQICLGGRARLQLQISNKSKIVEKCRDKKMSPPSPSLCPCVQIILS